MPSTWRQKVKPGCDLPSTSKTYDLVLLDLALPGLNRPRDPGAHTRAPRLNLPVIMITAYGTVGNVVDAMKAGASELRSEALG